MKTRLIAAEVLRDAASKAAIVHGAASASRLYGNAGKVLIHEAVVKSRLMGWVRGVSIDAREFTMPWEKWTYFAAAGLWLCWWQLQREVSLLVRTRLWLCRRHHLFYGAAADAWVRCHRLSTY